MIFPRYVVESQRTALYAAFSRSVRFLFVVSCVDYNSCVPFISWKNCDILVSPMLELLLVGCFVLVVWNSEARCGLSYTLCERFIF